MALLSVENLRVNYVIGKDKLRAVDGVSLQIREREVLGIVGESGCGKSTLALSVLRLLPARSQIEGRVLYRGQDILRMSEKELREIRGNKISLVFQDPTSSLDPVFTIGYQVAEAVTSHRVLDSSNAWLQVVDILRKVRMPVPEKRSLSFPHELSGGMRQRAMIAIGLVCEPELLIADEPTTNLDVTVEAQMLELFKEIKRETGSSMMIISHNFGVIAELADRVSVMYAGDQIESADVKTIFKEPRHPYTSLLLRSVPRADRKLPKLESIKGDVPSLIKPPSGCKFHPRCPYAKETCRSQKPRLAEVGSNHFVACLLVDGEPG